MEKGGRRKENKKVEQQAEDILRAYADELDAQYAVRLTRFWQKIPITKRI